MYSSETFTKHTILVTVQVMTNKLEQAQRRPLCKPTWYPCWVLSKHSLLLYSGSFVSVFVPVGSSLHLSPTPSLVLATWDTPLTLRGLAGCWSAGVNMNDATLSSWSSGSRPPVVCTSSVTFVCQGSLLESGHGGD